MIDFIIILVGGFIAFRMYSVSLILGLIVSLLVLAIILYRRGAALCMAVAMRNYSKGKKIKAMEWFDRAFKIGMKFDEKITYTYYLLREGRVGKCEEILSSMLAFRTQKPQERNKAKANHAMLLMKTGRVYEAVEELEEILPTYKNTSLYANLGFCYLVQGDMQKAQKFNEEAYEYNSDDPIIIDNMMQTYAKLGQFDKAFELSEKLMEKKPAFREAYYDTAVVEYQLGKKEDAVSRLEHALTIPTSFLTTVSDEVIRKLKEKIESGAEPEGTGMVFLEAKSASLPDVPTLRTRPAAPVRRTTETGVTESDDPISFTSPAKPGEEEEVREIDDEPIDFTDAAQAAESEPEDEEDSVFL